jgi:hypothetical protein
MVAKSAANKAPGLLPGGLVGCKWQSPFTIDVKGFALYIGVRTPVWSYAGLLRGLNPFAQDLWNFKSGDYCFNSQKLCEKWVPARILGEDESAVLFDGKSCTLERKLEGSGVH